jgi:hypothetical protein
MSLTNSRRHGSEPSLHSYLVQAFCYFASDSIIVSSLRPAPVAVYLHTYIIEDAVAVGIFFVLSCCGVEWRLGDDGVELVFYRG